MTNEPITVVVPTYNRPHLVANWTSGLLNQTRRPDRILAVVRNSDHETLDAISVVDGVEIVEVDEPGVIAALNAGANAVSTGIVVFTDDDAIARPEWLSRIEAHFANDPSLTGVGGRDVIHGEEVPPEQRKYLVGRLVRGRPIGNHHLGAGPPRSVEVLKGVNAAYRRSHLASEPYDHRLRGTGGHHHELLLGNELISQGRTLIYDPDIVVDHYPAPRADGWRTNAPEVGRDEAFNEQLAYAPRSSLVRLGVLAWGLALGSTTSPGLGKLLQNPTKYSDPLNRLRTNTAGRLQGWRAAAKS